MCNVEFQGVGTKVRHMLGIELSYSKYRYKSCEISINCTIVTTEFILLGFSGTTQHQISLFTIFLCTYIITLSGNLSIIITYKLSPSLHTPMYFFLANFSLLEILYVSCTVPKMLSSLLSDCSKVISFSGCAIQMYCFLLFGGTECYMLAAMAYDRYNAICHPLLYTLIMREIVCIRHIVGSYVISAVNSLIHTVFTFSLPFCGSKEIDHFFCDVPPVLELSCQDIWVNELVIFMVGGSVVIGSFIITMISYIEIISKILKLRSASGKKKSFATCSSHLIVVTLFYGSTIFMYFRPRSSYRIGQNSLVSLMYTVIAPLLNPFIYSLRNKEVKSSIKNVFLKQMKF
ncbi:olfactory receptor 5G3-like [Bufo gargarizans]|uniref:olfactory receptor 5G3-like n=1 Tax=Bufo gargarizans TaxID=30331 RepID=UPI001CF22452|nr:olfactory receptor 5G3-like [Bufo gargarizans]